MLSLNEAHNLSTTCTCTQTHTLTLLQACTHIHAHIPGPVLALIHSAGMSVWRQAMVCAPGMRNLTSGLEFEPPHSSLHFSEIYSHNLALHCPAEYLNSDIKSSQTTSGLVSCRLNEDLPTYKKQGPHQ